MSIARLAVALSTLIVLSACSSNGPQGPEGPQGPSGATGPAGSDGSQGVQGVAGPEGPTGATGVAGPEGGTGPQGIQGPQGAVLVLDGGVVTGPPGSSVVVTPIAAGATCPAGGLRVTQLSDGGISSVCNGVAGATGSQGATGPTGASGSAGISGATGPAGAAGPAGDAGPQGAAGSQGAIGPQGPPGAVLYLDGGVVLASQAIKFAGYTSALYSGNLGSATGANAKCQAQFPGSYFCTVADFDLANTASLPPAATGAWIDVARATTGVRNASSCDNDGAWTTNSAESNGADLNDAGTYYQSANCSSMKPLACCRGGAANVIFRGYTSATYSGNLGSATGANGKCQSQYSGSFFCTQADFDLANTGAAPATAAWIDLPRATSGERNASSCDDFGGWTSNSAEDNGADLNDAGTYYQSISCQSSLPLACCQNQ